MTYFRSNPNPLTMATGIQEGVFAPLAVSQKQRSGLFKPENNVGAANTSTFVTYAAQNILPLNVRNHTLANREHYLKVRVLGTPVKIDRLEQLLTAYSPALKTFLVDGFLFGFRIHFLGEKSSFESPNLKSALQSPEIVSVKLQKEIDTGTIVGPFHTHPLPGFRTSPIGLLSKKTPLEFRLIHHLSYPKGWPVNDSIPDDFSSVHYATINDAVNILKNLGAVCYMAKTDIKYAFRIIPVQALDCPLLGIK